MYLDKYLKSMHIFFGWQGFHCSLSFSSSPSRRVAAAAYWLLQTHPASGKHSVLQQWFQALPQTTAALDSWWKALLEPADILSLGLWVNICLYYECIILPMNLFHAHVDWSEVINYIQWRSVSLWFLLNPLHPFWPAPRVLLGNTASHQAAIQPCLFYCVHIQCPSSAVCFFFCILKQDTFHQQPPVTHYTPRMLSTKWVRSWILSIPCSEVIQ